MGDCSIFHFRLEVEVERTPEHDPDLKQKQGDYYSLSFILFLNLKECVVKDSWENHLEWFGIFDVIHRLDFGLNSAILGLGGEISLQ